jgi:multidrug efflux system membrane fusion protein
MTRLLACRISLASILAIVVIGCNSSPPPVKPEPPPVTVSKPVVRDIVDRDTFEGYIRAMDSIEVRPRVRGHLLKVNFVEGQMVKKGDLLYEIDPEQYQAALDAANAQLAAAEAELQLAKAEYTRTRSLAAKNAASREELDIWTGKQAVAVANKQKAKAAIREAENNLKFTKVTATIDGKMSRTLVDAGNLVNAGGGETLLTTLVSVNPVQVQFFVDERALLDFRRERTKNLPKDAPQPEVKDLKIPVFVALENDTDFPHKGVIVFADNHVNPSTGTIEVRGELSNESRIFVDGYRARVQVPVSEPHKATLITDRAVSSDQDRKYVYVVNDKNIVERRDVTLGRLNDGLQVVLSGLKGEDRVIVNGIQRVRDGLEVNPREVDMPGDQRAAK